MTADTGHIQRPLQAGIRETVAKLCALPGNSMASSVRHKPGPPCAGVLKRCIRHHRRRLVEFQGQTAQYSRTLEHIRIGALDIIHVLSDDNHVDVLGLSQRCLHDIAVCGQLLRVA